MSNIFVLLHLGGRQNYWRTGVGGSSTKVVSVESGTGQYGAPLLAGTTLCLRLSWCITIDVPLFELTLYVGTCQDRISKRPINFLPNFQPFGGHTQTELPIANGNHLPAQDRL